MADMRSVLKCVHCGTCRAYCPVFEVLGWESTNARGRVLIYQGILEGLQIDDSVIKTITTCTTCGLCEEICPAGAAPPSIVENARKYLAEKGLQTDVHKELCDIAIEKGNPLDEEKSRLHWLEEPDLPERAEYVYFVGCMNSYRYPEVAKKTFELLKPYGVSLLRDEVCCGSPLERTGSDASKLIEHNIKQIREMGAHTIITGCAGCYASFRKYYPDDLKILHVAEFLIERVDSLDIKKQDIIVSYHDPCHLGRDGGVYEAPRDLIRKATTLVEMASHHETSHCCGGGGGVRRGYPELSLKIAEKRINEMPDEAELLVTSCPLCRSNLEQVCKKRVIDLVELL
ncbi:(Fe-S)-binding protein [Methanohalophilus sp.]|uniref:(Fe-S)-binding protein n=1 Tax=Methanohalophilus sp. TaxID=1966352 RepID=UPI00263206C6|nr:(Fe-S)-binding protein [Methanohalophilus sp.]MDK2893008.1 fumarate reductase (CoM/CoB) subunit [Methanohalophilus sp.]